MTDTATTEPEIVDAEIVPDPPPEPEPAPAGGQALELHRPAGTTELIHAANATERVAIATDVATNLDQIIRRQGMRTKVGSQKKLDPETGEPARDETGKEVWVPRWHVNVEGWQTLATLLGLAVVPLEPRPVADPQTGRPVKTAFEVYERSYYSKRDGGGLKAERRYTVEGYDWRCRCEVYKDGTLIGAGESVCSRSEQRWKEADDYAVMGMAQTRATSRAIAAAARWIVTLAGYSATPAEEMPPDAAQEPPAPAPAPEGKWAGPELPGEHRPVVLGAIATLAGVDNHTAIALLDSIETSLGGYLPTSIAKALRRLELDVTARRQQDQAAEQPPEQPVEVTKPPAPQGTYNPLSGRLEPTPEQDINQGPNQAWETGRAAGEAARQQQMTEPPPQPGTVPQPNLQGITNADTAIKRLRGAGCICRDPLAPPTDRGAFNDACPLDGHGIPF